MLQKVKNELATKEATTIPSNEIEEEKNHSEDPNKLLSSMTEQIILDSDNQDNDIKEEKIIEKKNNSAKRRAKKYQRVFRNYRTYRQRKRKRKN